jgi:tagaturonate reductase
MIPVLNRSNVKIDKSLPIKVLQFGEGNFLRAFADWMIDLMNEEANMNMGVAVVQPIAHGLIEKLNNQEGLYHHTMRGLKNNQEIEEIRLISCIQKCIDIYSNFQEYIKIAELPELEIVISNTTEAGIAFEVEDLPKPGDIAKTFPGKVTQLLKRRFDHFNQDPEKGLIFIPCELIEKNGVILKDKIIDYARLWNFGSDFINWIHHHNHFANTLVDRIVPGYPRNEIDEIQKYIGFKDDLVVSSEYFHAFYIEGNQIVRHKFPADQCNLNVEYVDDLIPYRSRKVRILNGAHTVLVATGLLSGISTVKEGIEDKEIGQYLLAAISEEIIPTIQLPPLVLSKYMNEVMERFKNPFIRHELKTISLNSIAKFKVRVLPSILDYFYKTGKWPVRLTLAFAALIKLYLDKNDFDIQEAPETLKFLNSLEGHSLEENGRKILEYEEFWDQDLTQLDGLVEVVTDHLKALEKDSLRTYLTTLI